MASEMPRIIPVIDVMNGVVVHAVGGRRDEYKPLRSKIVDSTDPLTVAKAMLKATGSEEIYVVDLDAIRSNGNTSTIIDNLLDRIGKRIWLDCGVREETDLHKHVSRQNVRLVLPTETLRCASAYSFSWPFERLALCIDLQQK